MNGITDESADIAKLMELLRDFNPRNDVAVSAALSELFRLPGGSLKLFEVAGIIGERLENISTFAASVEDPAMYPELRDRVTHAARNVAAMFSPETLHSNWRHIKTSCLLPADMEAFRWFSMVARRHRPRRTLTDETRQQLIADINRALTELPDAGFQWWAAEALEAGLLRLKNRVEFFPFFGHEALLNELILQKERIEALGVAICERSPFEERQSTDESENQPEKNSPWSVLKNIAAVIGLAATVIAAPDKVSTAIEHYLEHGYEHYLSIARRVIDLPRATPKLLPPPSREEREE
jgi:hypothetical protein